MTSVATSAFAWALEHLGEWEPDELERRPAYDLWPDDASPAAAADGSRSGDPAPLHGAIAIARARLASGETSSAELVEQALAAIDADSERLTAYVELLADEARVQAAALDDERKAGIDRGPLHGIPISVKDVIHVAGATTRCGSLAYEKRPDRDAWAVGRLREAGAIVLGKVATHEFALGVTSPQSRNPHDESRIPGGSSCGSAVAVATGMGFASLCTDTRASSRVPAALSGVVGLKPTYGTIPTTGVVPLSWTMDHVGIIAGDVAGAATLLDVLRGSGPRAGSGCASPIGGLRIGLPRAAWEGVDPAVETSIATALRTLADSGASLVDVDAPAAEDFVGANAGGLVTSRCEAAAFHRGLGLDRSLYWDEVRDQLDAADEVLATDYVDAQRYRAWLRERMLDAVRGFDALVMPTSPVTAPPVADAEDYLTVLSRNAILWSFVGFPAMSVPSVPTPGGLPVGLQVVGPPHSEATMVAVAAAVERGCAG